MQLYNNLLQKSTNNIFLETPKAYNLIRKITKTVVYGIEKRKIMQYLFKIRLVFH